MLQHNVRILLFTGIILYASHALAGGVAVIDSNYLKKSSAADKNIWERWIAEFKSAQTDARSEVTKRYALEEEALFKDIDVKVNDYLLNTKRCDRILDLTKDPEAKKTFSPDASLTFELLDKINKTWFPVKLTNPIIPISDSSTLK